MEKSMNDRVTRTTKNDRIIDFFRSRIQDGTYKPNQRLPSEIALCSRFGVTRATVGRALRELEHAGLIMRRQGSGSFVRQPDEHRTLTFGLLVPSLGEGEIFEPICNAIATATASHRHRLLWGQFSSSEASDRCVQSERLCQSYIEQKVDGVFFAPIELADNMYESNERIVGLLSAQGIPVVLLDQDVVKFPERSAFDLVGIDNRRAGYVLANHLLEQGCERIAFVAHPHSAQTVDARIAGYREALLDQHQCIDIDRVHFGDPDDPAFIDALLKGKQRPDAVMCANDYTAAKLIAALLRRGVQIPDDIRVTGVDDLKYAGLLTVSLTTIRQPCRAMGEAAAHALFERADHPAMPGRDILLDFQLVPRNSSGLAGVR